MVISHFGNPGLMNAHGNRNIGSTDETWVKAAITKANGREH